MTRLKCASRISRYRSGKLLVVRGGTQKPMANRSWINRAGPAPRANDSKQRIPRKRIMRTSRLIQKKKGIHRNAHPSRIQDPCSRRMRRVSGVALADRRSGSCSNNGVGCWSLSANLWRGSGRIVSPDRAGVLSVKLTHGRPIAGATVVDDRFRHRRTACFQTARPVVWAMPI